MAVMSVCLSKECVPAIGVMCPSWHLTVPQEWSSEGSRGSE